MLSGEWMITSTIEAVCFFYFTQKLSRRWMWLQDKRFIRKIFLTTLLLKVVWVLMAYVFYSSVNGEPFEFAAADSHFYASIASEFAGYIKTGDIHTITNYPNISISDMGYPLWLTLLNLIFGNSLLVPRLINALFSACTAVLLYKLAANNFGMIAGRLAAIMFMLLPNFFFYAGIHLKETMMIFLVVAYAYNADKLIHGEGYSWVNIVFTILGGLSLFLFRTPLGIVAFFALFTALIFTRKEGQSKKKWKKRLVTAFWIFGCIAVLLSGRVINEIEDMYKASNTNQEQGMEYRATREGGNSLAQYGSMAIFAPMILAIPFPTFIEASAEQQNQMMFAGGYFVKNIFSFFVFIALIILVRERQWREHLFIITFFLAYLLIIAKSSFAVSERFHLPAMPFLLIMAAFGITRIRKKEKKWYLPYVVFMVLIVIGWNWFKLAGRGLA